MTDNILKLINHKIELYQQMQEIASEERKEASISNYTRILSLQEMRQQILNKIEQVDESINSKLDCKSQKNKNAVIVIDEKEAQSKIIDIIKNILQIDEETLKAVNSHKDEILRKRECY